VQRLTAERDFFSFSLWGNGNPQNKRVTLPCPDGLRTSREYKRNEDDDDEDDDGDFIGNV
jgi:hypothetical protein